jgi:hypothetical protein
MRYGDKMPKAEAILRKNSPDAQGRARASLTGGPVGRP